MSEVQFKTFSISDMEIDGSSMPTEEADRRSYRSALRGSVFSDEESVREISAARRRSSSALVETLDVG